MKTIIVLLAGMLISVIAPAQKVKYADVPAKVKEAFEKKYPGVKVEQWEKENGDYEATFDLNKIESSALFDVEGNFMELEQEIKVAELPKVIVDFLNNNYSNQKISETSKIIDSSGNIAYEAEIKEGKREFDLLFDSKGNFIKKQEDIPAGKK
jgi:hypothetical protein